MLWIMSNKKILVFIFFFGLAVLTLLLAVFRTKVSFLGKAVGENTPLLEQSYLLGSPLIARADGEEKIQIFAFVLNDQGRGVAGKSVQISTNPSLNIKPVQPQTDKFGQVIFEATSSQPGQFAVSASVDGQPFPQTMTLTFQ